MNILLSEVNSPEIQRYQTEKWPVLLITGPKGTGKNDLAVELANALTTEVGSQLHIGNEKLSIGIDEVRSIKQFSKLKSSQTGKVRVVVIYNADQMSEEAQNASLKLLEEPKSDVLYILTAVSSNKLLPTVQSRCQTLEVVNPTLKQYENRYDNKPDDISKAFAMTDGRSRYMHEILSGDQSQVSELFALAKKYYSSSVYERIIMNEEVIKQADTEGFLFALQRITRYLISASDSKKAETLTKSYKLLEKLQLAAQTNVNPKLLFDQLALNL